ncbi:ABC transporter periplasmic binding protein, thiB subfamily [Marinitoga piezophila KA3]|uniref:ABC transporter periplasmic binding protein, thiB subfamily n=1 Tax=Marinitoga piezophila (strain DSM 14283 / JCM 11233 / KA3) TaxID=443254 RepID=H2J5G3_MARPK|nr:MULTISPECIES: thiamine ABC transporter substrate-binding protein [Marinitoga]AEX86107.1 ABC transporter periplasmic binding protein, thiB subfamily [Marinitoga piezophila KA3]NUU98210.1 ABC transporter substrate-binding protein [Marinitoga sp. 1138]
MKKGIVFLSVLLLSSLLFAKTLTVYVYDSLDWIKKGVIQKFENMYNVDVNVVVLGDGGTLLSRLKLEKKNPKADVVIGLDQSLSVLAINEDLVIPYKPLNISKIKDDLIYDKSYHLIPYDYGAIAIVYDPEKLKSVPKSFEDLTKLKKKLIIQDPRTSSTGQAFLLWTIAVYKDQWKDFWKRLKPAILTVTPGWGEAFAKFEAGEAPMMVSYATDGAYSYYYYKSTKYKAFIPQEGAYIQIEGAGIVKGTKNPELAKRFIEFLLFDDFQKEVPLNQWMFPVTNVKLPEAFKYALVPEKVLTIDSEELNKNLENWLDEWEEIMY